MNAAPPFFKSRPGFLLVAIFAEFFLPLVLVHLALLTLTTARHCFLL